MPKVTHCGATYECAVAIKGSNFVRLVDANDKVLAYFGGVSDFSVFTISDGDWTDEEAPDNCYVAIMHEDGTIGKSTVKLCDIGAGGGGGGRVGEAVSVTPSNTDNGTYHDIVVPVTTENLIGFYLYNTNAVNTPSDLTEYFIQDMFVDTQNSVAKMSFIRLNPVTQGGTVSLESTNDLTVGTNKVTVAITPPPSNTVSFPSNPNWMIMPIYSS